MSLELEYLMRDYRFEMTSMLRGRSDMTRRQPATANAAATLFEFDS